MSQAISPSAGRPYGLMRICRVWQVRVTARVQVPRSTVYARRQAAQPGEGQSHKRGPRQGALSDEALPPQGPGTLLAAIRRVLGASPWVGEGYRKIWARLRFLGVRAAPRRVLRLMRENDLLAPTRTVHAHGPKAHDGTIITERPDQMWGTDQTSAPTEEGNAAIFFVVDHCTWECLGIGASRRGRRWEALEPLRQAVRGTLGGYREGVAAGLALRHDHGSQFVSHTYQGELRFLGIESSPAFVREPQGNGCAERFAPVAAPLRDGGRAELCPAGLQGAVQPGVDCAASRLPDPESGTSGPQAKLLG